MPRKTRQQKLAAEIRTLRSQIKTVVVSVPTENTTAPEPISKSRLADLFATTNPATTRTIVSDYAHVTKDLKKVAVLATIALLIEIVLSLTLNFGFAKLIPGLS